MSQPAPEAESNGHGEVTAVSREWAAKLMAEFPEDKVFGKPAISCYDCSHSPSKACGKTDNRGLKHEKIRCPDCKAWITAAHTHLDYVGHADVTERLLQVDPYWTWRPAYTNPDKDVLLAAIASGNPSIVQAVIANAPPLLDRSGGMWIELTVHDDAGYEVTRLGYGDADGKGATGAAMKETIGDGLRNAALRFGVARSLWSKQERGAEEDTSGPDGETAKPAARTRAKAKSGKDDSAKGNAGAGDEGPRNLASLAYSIAGNKDKTENDLRHAVYEIASRNRWLSEKVTSPFDGVLLPLHAVIAQAKQKVLDRTPPPGPPRDIPGSGGPPAAVFSPPPGPVPAPTQGGETR
jgi:hypothetical protein